MHLRPLGPANSVTGAITDPEPTPLRHHDDARNERTSMYAAHCYVIRQATAADERTLHRLAELDGQRPLSGPALIGEIGGAPAAALSLTDGRLVADPFQRTAVLGRLLRIRAGALDAYSRTPSLAARIRVAMVPFRSRAAHGPATTGH